MFIANMHCKYSLQVLKCLNLNFTFFTFCSFGGDLLKHVRSKHSEKFDEIFKKLKQKKSKVSESLMKPESVIKPDPVVKSESAIKSDSTIKSESESNDSNHVLDGPTRKLETIIKSKSPISVKKEEQISSPVKNASHGQEKSDDEIKSFETKSKKKQICQFCSFECRFKKSLIQHVKVKHPKKKNLKVHDDDDDIAKNEKPPQLQENIDSKRLRKIACSKCAFRTNKQNHLENHFRLKHPQQSKFKMRNNNKKMKSQNVDLNGSSSSVEIASITKVDVGSKDLFCSHCKFKTSKKVLLIRHVRGSHPKNVKVLLKKMKKQFSSFQKEKDRQSEKVKKISRKNNEVPVKQELTTNTPEKDMFKKFSCPECSFQSRFKVNVSRHLSVRHPGAEPRVLILTSQPEISDNSKSKKHTSKLNVAKIASNGVKQKLKNSGSEKVDDNLSSVTKIRNGDKKEKNKKKDREEDYTLKTDQGVQNEDNNDKTKKSVHLSCSRCPFVAKRHPDLIVHFDKSHLKRGTDRRCPHCNYRTSLSVLLNSHVVTVHSKNGIVKSNNPNSSQSVWRLFMDESNS